ncbi:MAG: hypothetical protein KGZ77_00105, partial [Rhodobacteraceae bacterium]|nr:hypothetical protein [Paracoccaceae bacterium]
MIELENGRLALFDFADMRNKDDASDKRCDLEKELRECLGDDKEIDVVAFTHLDTDHCNRAKDVFHLEHAAKYQGGDRIKIKTMWVPATAILEEGVEGQARTLRAEARHRFIEGKGIRVFSRPDALDQFLRDRDIEPSKRRNLISDAGTLCPEFNLASAQLIHRIRAFSRLGSGSGMVSTSFADLGRRRGMAAGSFRRQTGDFFWLPRCCGTVRAGRSGAHGRRGFPG